MESLLAYAFGVNVEVMRTCGTKARNFHIHSEMVHEDDFIFVTPNDNIQNDCLLPGKIIYSLVMEVVSYRGKAEYEHRWENEAKQHTFWVGFVDISLEAVKQQALDWAKSRIDTTYPSDTKVIKGCFTNYLQPLVVSTRRHPHYLENNNDTM